MNKTETSHPEVAAIYTLHWKSSKEDRFGTDMNERAEALVRATPDVVLVDHFGGTALGAWAGDLPCDNGFDIRCTAAVAHMLAKQVSAEVRYPVSCA